MGKINTTSRDGLRIIVLGYIVRGPLGGLAWHHLQYVMGLSKLGHDVYFLEDSGDFPGCYHPARQMTDGDPTYGLGFAGRTFKRVGLADRWGYWDAATSKWLGPLAEKALAICATADLLLNLSPMDPMRPWFTVIPKRALIDTDPAFTQIHHLQRPAAHARALQHNSFFSFGENIGFAGRNSVPDDGLPWQPTRQPVVTEAWPVIAGPAKGNFTTVMQWDSYPELNYEGNRYGLKSASFGPYIDLPGRTPQSLELAIGSPTAPRQTLRENGWVVRNPLTVTRDPWTYQRFIQKSKGEFTVAKHGYVTSRCGWFSERTAAYLASARPALVQNTGFSDWLSVGDGVIGFDDPDQALAGIEEINSRYEYHCKAAREVAKEYFDFRRVLPHLVERAMHPAQCTTAEAANKDHHSDSGVA